MVHPALSLILFLVACPGPPDEAPPPGGGPGDAAGGPPPGTGQADAMGGPNPPPAEGEGQGEGGEAGPPPGEVEGGGNVDPADMEGPEDGRSIPYGLVRDVPSSFENAEGTMVQVKGTISFDVPDDAEVRDGTLRLDFYEPTEDGGLSKVVHSEALDDYGDWSVKVPQGYGDLVISAYLDYSANGHDPNEPVAETDVFTVAQSNVTGIDLRLSGQAMGPTDGAAGAQGEEGLTETPGEGEGESRPEEGYIPSPPEKAGEPMETPMPPPADAPPPPPPEGESSGEGEQAAGAEGAAPEAVEEEGAEESAPVE